MSTLAWLAYSEAERRSALDLIALFKERDTRDELGLGVIRDALADLFFPGTSTIQRRARYFLFVPWTYLRLEKKHVPSADVAKQARRDEIELIKELIKVEDEEGIIGVQARETLKRLPSNIYWQGLGRLGIRLFPGSQDQYHRSLDRYYKRLQDAANVQAEDREAAGARLIPNWLASLPPCPQGFPKGATFVLARGEAEYLSERILSAVPTSLLAFLVSEGKPSETTAFPWMHPQFAEFPPAIRGALEHSRCFSELMHGAAMLYNLMLAQKQPAPARRKQYTEALGAWRSILERRWRVLRAWDRHAFWDLLAGTGARLRPTVRRFVDDWLGIVFATRGSGIGANAAARDLIHRRERGLKGRLARLDNAQALKAWKGAAGANQIDYRWGIAQMIVGDIQRRWTP
jgi:uncharacterized protein DUF6361